MTTLYRSPMQNMSMRITNVTGRYDQSYECKIKLHDVYTSHQIIILCKKLRWCV